MNRRRIRDCSGLCGWRAPPDQHGPDRRHVGSGTTTRFGVLPRGNPVFHQRLFANATCTCFMSKVRCKVMRNRSLSCSSVNKDVECYKLKWIGTKSEARHTDHVKVQRKIFILLSSERAGYARATIRTTVCRACMCKENESSIVEDATCKRDRVSVCITIQIKGTERK